MSAGTILPSQPRQAIEKTGKLHGLLRTVTVTEEEAREGSESPAWVGGFNFQPESCNEVLLWDACQLFGQVRVRGPINANGEFVPSLFDANANIEINVVDLGGGQYQIRFDDPAQSGIVSDPNGPANNTDGYLNCILTPATPDEIFHIEFSLNGGGNVPGGIFVLDIPASQVNSFVSGGSGASGAFVDMIIDTNFGFTTQGLPNITEALILALTAAYGFPFLFGTLPSATEITVRQVSCDSVLPAPTLAKVITDTPEAVDFSPYQLYTSVQCRRYEEGADPEFDRKARNELLLGTTKAIECELWDGALKGAINPFCTDPNPSFVSEVGLGQILSPLIPAGNGEVVAVSPEDAIASLIQALANCGAGLRGALHGQPYLISKWKNLDALNTNGQILETAVDGHPVVSGAGYSGSAPLDYRALAVANGFDAQPDNTTWAYVTGTVQVLVTAPRAIAFDNPKVGTAHAQQSTIDENRTTVLFEREGAAVWDLCCTFAVLVDMC